MLQSGLLQQKWKGHWRAALGEFPFAFGPLHLPYSPFPLCPFPFSPFPFARLQFGVRGPLHVALSPFPLPLCPFAICPLHLHFALFLVDAKGEIN